MATTTNPSTSSKSPDRPGVPLRSTSQNYINAQRNGEAEAAAGQKVQQIKIPDGRKNSTGEAVVSPTETWRPNFTRKQSWCQQDLKREILQTELDKQTDEGQGTGFTEGGEGTRQI